MGPDGDYITGSNILIDGGGRCLLVRRPRPRIAPEKQALSRYGCRARMTAGQQAGDTMLRHAGPGVAPSLGPPR